MVKKEVKEWVSRAERDFEEAKFLFDHDRPPEDVAFFLYQAVEKYLKGFLINNGWELEKIHDLVKLVKDAAKFDKSFEKFIPLTEEMADYYIESRYPVGYLVVYTKNEIEKSIKDVEMLISFLKERLN
jgi:HEPN domain-containing protein